MRNPVQYLDDLNQYFPKKSQINLISDKEVPSSVELAQESGGLDEIAASLKESEERYRTLIDNLPDAVLVFHKNKAEYVNEAGKRLLRIKDISDINCETVMEFIHPDHRDSLKERIRRFIRESSPSARYEDTLYCADGTVIEVEVTVVPITYKGHTALQFVIRDITARKQAEKVLNEKRAQLDRITDNMFDIITQVTPDGIMEYVSPSVQKIMGTEPESLLGLSIFEFVHPDDLERVLKSFRRFIKEQAPGRVDFRFRHADGHYIWLDSVGNLLFNKEGKITGAIINTRDITQKKYLEKEVARLDQLNLVGEMAAGIAHEIRNPMTTARGFLQLLKAKDECAKFTDYFELIIEELDRANSIITEFLSMAKNKRIDLIQCNLKSIIQALAPLIQADAAIYDKSVEITCEEVPDLLLDEKEIRQLILNLVINGLEAMENRGVLSIRIFTRDHEVILSVQDQGKGIDPEILEKLGTPFFTTKEKGTGLGLAICYSVAARHNANIDVKSGPQGTTFWVRFKIPRSQ